MSRHKDYRWFIADLLTGDELVDVPAVLGGSTWGKSLNEPESIRCVIDMSSRKARAWNVRGRTFPGRVMLGVAEGDTVIGAGPIWFRRYADAAQTVTLTARGIWSYFDYRYVLNTLATEIALDEFTVVDPTDQYGKRRKGNPLLAAAYSGLSLGTYAKRLVQLAQTHTNGDVPVVFQSDEIGDWGRTIDAMEFERTGNAIRNLTRMENGIDVQFQPRYKAGQTGIEFLLRTGTTAEPLLTGGPHLWDFTATKPAGSGFVMEDDASMIASRGWATGGRSGDRFIVGRAEDPRLLDVGWALFEGLDSQHTYEDEPRMLDEYAAELTKIGYGPSTSWAFDAERHRPPVVGSYEVGDWANLHIGKYDAATKRGIAYMPEGGKFPVRIIGLDGVHGRETVTVTCAPRLGE